jgi:hypothetical protein
MCRNEYVAACHTENEEEDEGRGGGGEKESKGEDEDEEDKKQKGVPIHTWERIAGVTFATSAE